MKENQIEELLILETHTITLPDGTTKPITMSRQHWQSYQMIVASPGWSPEDVVELVFRAVQENGHSFEEYFPEIVAYIHQCRNKIHRQLYG